MGESGTATEAVPRVDLEQEIVALRAEVAELRELAADVEELRRTVAAAAALLIGVSRVSPDAVEAASPDR